LIGVGDELCRTVGQQEQGWAPLTYTNISIKQMQFSKLKPVLADDGYFCGYFVDLSLY